MRIDMAKSSLCNSQKPWQIIKLNAATVSVSYLGGRQEQEAQVLSRATEAVDSHGRHLTVPFGLFTSASSQI